MTIDPVRRKAEFREQAREIMRKDREMRKFGMSVDTGGAIIRVMERAYKAGAADALSPHGDGPVQGTEPAVTVGATPWIEIPPRFRDMLARLMHFCLRTAAWSDGTGARWVVLQFCDGPIPNLRKWHVLAPKGQDADGHVWKSYAFGDGTVAGLAKLGLLLTVKDGVKLAMTTPRADCTWDAFLNTPDGARYAECDRPTGTPASMTVASDDEFGGPADWNIEG